VKTLSQVDFSRRTKCPQRLIKGLLPSRMMSHSP
jgi:hypothetical protein